MYLYDDNLIWLIVEHWCIISIMKKKKIKTSIGSRIIYDFFFFNILRLKYRSLNHTSIFVYVTIPHLLTHLPHNQVNACMENILIAYTDFSSIQFLAKNIISLFSYIGVEYYFIINFKITISQKYVFLNTFYYR